MESLALPRELHAFGGFNAGSGHVVAYLGDKTRNVGGDGHHEENVEPRGVVHHNHIRLPFPLLPCQLPNPTNTSAKHNRIVLKEWAVMIH